MDDSAYYLRSKRRKTSNGEEITHNHSENVNLKRKNPIMHVPLEVLQNILRFITYQELSDAIRSVNRKFKLAAEDILNKSFKNLGRRIQELADSTFDAIRTTNDDMEVKCLCRLLNILDLMHFQQSVIMATIWRYVYNMYYKTHPSCMYGGLILDLFDLVLAKSAWCPYQIYGPAVVKDYALPDEIKHLIQLTKIFCIHFDKTVEEPVTNALCLSGCKILDLLDCATFATKTVIYERTTLTGTFSAKYCYFLHNAWFIAFGIPADRQISHQQKQRMMHMRIRRILLAHTEMFMQQSQYERELVLRASPVIKKPSVIVYTGYGDVHDTFFYYGAMNDAAYLQKFHLADDDDEPEDGEDVEEEMHLEEAALLADEAAEEGGGGGPDAEDEEEEEFALIPHLGLEIDVRIDCPLAYAPLMYVRAHERIGDELRNGGMFSLAVEFNCPGAYYPRLPRTHNYYKKISTRVSHSL